MSATGAASVRLDEHEREQLARLADVLIPEGMDMPAASQAGVHRELLDRALAARPDLADSLLELLARTALEPPEAAVERLAREGGVALGVLTEIVAGAYFMDTQVRRRLGYPGQQAIPIEPEPDLLEALTAPVAARGPVWRSADP